MKKFKLTWDERVCDEDGYTLYFENKSQIIEAEDEDSACDQWDKDNEYNENQNGLDDCVEVVEHELFEKNLIVSMPDGSDWAVPVELIARDRAEHFSYEFNVDITESLLEDTLPLFESDSYEIHDWAANSMSWDEVKDHAVRIKKSIVDFNYGWVNGEWEVK